MDWTRSLYDGMPNDPENDADTALANNTMATTLWSFFSALCAKGFREEYAYGLTLTYFEGLWNTSDMVEVDSLDKPDMRDDCK